MSFIIPDTIMPKAKTAYLEAMRKQLAGAMSGTWRLLSLEELLVLHMFRDLGFRSSSKALAALYELWDSPERRH